ncbi:MAG TPA: hypothetical protein DCY72_03780 [Ruminococcaceae bacterium]|nr:hypothetical protein [Oscillospiraceae bacterium]
MFHVRLLLIRKKRLEFCVFGLVENQFLNNLVTKLSLLYTRIILISSLLSEILLKSQQNFIFVHNYVQIIQKLFTIRLVTACNLYLQKRKKNHRDKIRQFLSGIINGFLCGIRNNCYAIVNILYMNYELYGNEADFGMDMKAFEL